jgi:ribokinase
MDKMLKFSWDELKYSGIVGTGGIGSGKFFKINGDHTLGREESRSGHFLNINDYCKQHIILHYIKILLGPSFTVIPVGKVGDDDIGANLLSEMSATGFKMDFVKRVPFASTLFSFCFYYPDGSGGNLTTDNSASSMVDATFIDKVKKEIKMLGSKGIIMAAPEVPLSARQKLLELGRKNNLFCAASFTSEELRSSSALISFNNIDLIAINLDEAAALSQTSLDYSNPEMFINSAIIKLQTYNPNIFVSITAGKQGSWCWDGHKLNFVHSLKAEVISTAGAGDAFFSGLLCGIALGLHLFEAQQLATLVAGVSVTSPHTINKGIDRIALHKFFKNSKVIFSNKIKNLLED